jgi:ammonium transporter Rh
MGTFGKLFAILEILIIIGTILFTTYGEGAMAPTTIGSGDNLASFENSEYFAISRYYGAFQDVHVMIFIGFGFLMSFLRKNAFNSLGLTFLVGAFAIQWFILTDAFWHAAFADNWKKLEIDLEIMLRADFAAGSVLITYGVVLGTVSPTQLLMIAFIFMPFFSLNDHIGLDKLQIADLGGSMTVHMFGAFFGMALSIAMNAKKKAAKKSHENASVYHSDVFAMIGTVFLWLFWPSFNSALGSGNTQHRAIVNTYLSLTGSCVAAFIASYLIRGDNKFNMVDVQNATLAGGVALGAACDMDMGPGVAMLIGALTGVVSVFGYVHVQPFLDTKMRLHDTCGVNNLHGMPSVIGAIVGIVYTAIAEDVGYGDQLTNIWVS